MAVIACDDLDTEHLREEVRAMYTRIAQAPEGEFHFHRGPTPPTCSGTAVRCWRHSRRR